MNDIASMTSFYDLPFPPQQCLEAKVPKAFPSFPKFFLLIRTLHETNMYLVNETSQDLANEISHNTKYEAK